MTLSPARARIRYWLDAARWSLVVLLAFELGIRFFIVRSPQREYLPEWGVIPAEGSYSMQGLEGYAVQRYLANGEIETPYRDGIPVVVLGDSTTMAAQVSPSSNFVSLTESALRERGINADLRNLGRSARLIPDHVFLASAVNAAYAPRYLVVQVSADSFTLSYDPANENYFVSNGNGKLTLMHQTPPLAKDLAYRNLITLSAFLDHLDFRLWYSMQSLGAASFREISGAGNAGDRNANALPEVSGDEPDLRQFRRQVAEQVQALTEAYPNSEILFLVVADAPKLASDPEPKIVWARPGDTRLVKTLENIPGVKVVYTQKAFQEFYEQYHVLPRGNFNSAFNFGHLNRYGHQAVAQVLTEALEEILK
ncbi:MAG: hypothetical protein AB1750_06525 [Chloroflexota bacterium]